MKENECKDKEEQDDPEVVNSNSEDVDGSEQDKEDEEDEEAEEDAAQDDPAAAATAGVGGLDDDNLLPLGQPGMVQAFNPSVPASKPAGAGVTKAVRKNSKGPSATAVAAERGVKDKNPSPRGVVLGSGEKPKKGSKNKRSEGGDEEADGERPLVKKLKLAARGIRMH